MPAQAVAMVGVTMGVVTLVPGATMVALAAMKGELEPETADQAMVAEAAGILGAATVVAEAIVAKAVMAVISDVKCMRIGPMVR